MRRNSSAGSGLVSQKPYLTTLPSRYAAPTKMRSRKSSPHAGCSSYCASPSLKSCRRSGPWYQRALELLVECFLFLASRDSTHDARLTLLGFLTRLGRKSKGSKPHRERPAETPSSNRRHDRRFLHPSLHSGSPLDCRGSGVTSTTAQDIVVELRPPPACKDIQRRREERLTPNMSFTVFLCFFMSRGVKTCLVDDATRPRPHTACKHAESSWGAHTHSTVRTILLLPHMKVHTYRAPTTHAVM